MEEISFKTQGWGKTIIGKIWEKKQEHTINNKAFISLKQREKTLKNNIPEISGGNLHFVVQIKVCSKIAGTALNDLPRL